MPRSHSERSLLHTLAAIPLSHKSEAPADDGIIAQLAVDCGSHILTSAPVPANPCQNGSQQLGDHRPEPYDLHHHPRQLQLRLVQS